MDSIWNYPNAEIPLKGLLYARPTPKAINNSRFEKAYKVTAKAIKPYIKENGRVIYKNKFRIIISEK